MKYAQMKLNNGEQPANLFSNVRIVMGNSASDGSFNFKKGIFTAQLKASEGNDNVVKKYAFVIDRGKILFDTLYDREQNGFFSVEPMDKRCNPYGEYDKSQTQFPVNDTIVIPSNNGYFLYDARRKNYVTVDGVKKFKYIPYTYAWRNEKKYGTPLFYTVALRGKQKAFISCSNNQPLRLPNGEFWFASFESETHSDRGYYGRDIHLDYAGFPDKDTVIEMVVDESSREKYFYNVKLRKFIQPPDLSDLSGDMPESAEIMCTSAGIKGCYAMFRSVHNSWGRSPMALFDSNSQRISLGGLSEFSRINVARTYDENPDPDVFLLGLTDKDKEMLVQMGYGIENPSWVTSVMFDATVNALCVIEGNKIPEGSSNSYCTYGNLICYRVVDPDGNYAYYAYDIKRHGFYINPVKCPSKYLFDFVDIWGAQDDWTNVSVFTEPSRGRGWGGRNTAVINFNELELDDSTLLRAQKKQRQVAPALSENNIRSMVAETIKKLMETHYE